MWVSFDVEILGVREVRSAGWTKELAESVQPGLTVRGLEEHVSD